MKPIIKPTAEIIPVAKHLDLKGKSSLININGINAIPIEKNRNMMKSTKGIASFSLFDSYVKCLCS